MSEFEPKELQEGVVAPSLRLLSRRPQWHEVEDADQKALREIGEDPRDAIADAGTAFQSALKILGCTGNAPGPLIADAKRIGILAANDPRLADGIERILQWVAADRSTMDDAHNARPATLGDAWLTLHVVGALILRLASGPRSAYCRLRLFVKTSVGSRSLGCGST